MRVIGKIFKYFFLTLFTLAVVGILTTFIFGSLLFSFVNNRIMPSDEASIELESMPVNLSSTIYYKDSSTGQYVEWVTLQNSENREWVDGVDIPEDFKNAFISIEDQRFREHHGVDVKRTAAAVLNVFRGKNVFGGSTITQQLIKNVTNDRDVTVKRKVTEICRALRLEQRYTKDEILEWYMNIIYFGRGQYGIGAAAEYYFGKPVSELSLSQMCAIAGITNNPSKYDPYVRPENTQERRDLILDKMVEQGYISLYDSIRAKNEELVYAEHTKQEREGTEIYPYYVDTIIDDVIQYLQDTVGVTEHQATNMLYYGGYQIYACVDMDIQKKMDAFYQNPDNIPKTKDNKPLESSMVVIDPNTGDIVGLEGGVGEKTIARGLNWASSRLGRRPPGSSIKPIAVYGPAIDMELVTPNTYLLDSDSVTLEGSDWLPKNDGGRTYGWVNVRFGVVQSLNIISAQVLDKVTPATSYSFLTNTLHMDLEAADEDYSPLATGQLTIGTTTREMASAYTIFPSGGTFTRGRTFSHIYNHDGELLYENKPVKEAAITEKTAYWMTDILQEAVSSGTGKGARLSGVPCAGKTGTTTDAKDRWFVGYTPYYVGAVWTGYKKPAKISVSGNPAATIWKEIMQSIHEGLPEKDFPVPDDIELPEDTGYNPYWDEIEDEEPVLPEDDIYNPWLWEQPYETYPSGNGWSQMPWIDMDYEQSLNPTTPNVSTDIEEPDWVEPDWVEPDWVIEDDYEEPIDDWAALPEWVENAWGDE